MRPEPRDRQVERRGWLDERVGEQEPDERRKRELHDDHEGQVGAAPRRPAAASPPRCGSAALEKGDERRRREHRHVGADDERRAGRLQQREQSERQRHDNRINQPRQHATQGGSCILRREVEPDCLPVRHPRSVRSVLIGRCDDRQHDPRWRMRAMIHGLRRPTRRASPSPLARPYSDCGRTAESCCRRSRAGCDVRVETRMLVGHSAISISVGSAPAGRGGRPGTIAEGFRPTRCRRRRPGERRRV